MDGVGGMRGDGIGERHWFVRLQTSRLRVADCECR